MIERVHKYLGFFLVALLALMTIDVLLGVFTRYVLGSQLSWTEELARFLLIWIGMLGTAYASGERMHLSIDLLGPSLNATQQRWLQLAVTLAVILFAGAVLVVGGSRLLYITAKLGQSSAALRLPMTAVYSVVPVSGLLIVWYKLNQLEVWK